MEQDLPDEEWEDFTHQRLTDVPTTISAKHKVKKNKKKLNLFWFFKEGYQNEIKKLINS